MPAAEAIPQPFTNLQLELLKIYARTVDEKDLLEIKRLLGQYFADKASDLADKRWEEKGLSEAKILSKHLRTPYRRGFMFCCPLFVVQGRAILPYPVHQRLGPQLLFGVGQIEHTIP